MSDAATTSSQPPTEAAAARWAAARTGVIIAAAVGLAIRVALALISVGTNDVLIWLEFARSAGMHGYLDMWPRFEAMNHPPIPAAWAAVGYQVSGENEQTFSLWLKLPGLAAEVGAVLLVGSIVARRAGARAGRVAAWLYALNPAAILVSGYHGNTDPALAFLTLLTWRLADRGRFGWAGLALAASINVKIAPIPSALVLVACTRTWRDAVKMLGGLAGGMLPFFAMTLILGRVFPERLFLYRPYNFAWLADVLWFSGGLPWIGPKLQWLASGHRMYVAWGVIAIAIACAALRRWRPDRYDPLVIGGLYWTLFLFWGGSAFQYTIWPIPILAALRARLALTYGFAASVYLLWAYYEVGMGEFPLISGFYPGMSYNWNRVNGLQVSALLAIAVSILRRPLATRADSHAASVQGELEGRLVRDD